MTAYPYYIVIQKCTIHIDNYLITQKDMLPALSNEDTKILEYS